MILDSNQQMESEEEEGSKDNLSHQGGGEAADICQRTTSSTLSRYKLLKSIIVSESKHTI